jgi:hypothetical protein
MIALEVSVNDQVLCLAGRDDLTVLNTILNAVGKLDKNSSSNHLDLNVGGMHSGESEDRHDRWLSHHQLKVGDVVSIRVLKVEKADIPTEEIVMKPNDYKK